MPLYKLTNKKIQFSWTTQCEENFKKLKQKVQFNWTAQCKENLEKLKQSIADDAILTFPQFDKLFYLHTDASENAIDTVLSQKNEEDNLWPFTIKSKILFSVQRNCTTIDKEFYTIVWAVQKFHPHLLGQKLKKMSDLDCVSNKKLKVNHDFFYQMQALNALCWS